MRENQDDGSSHGLGTRGGGTLYTALYASSRGDGASGATEKQQACWGAPPWLVCRARSARTDQIHRKLAAAHQPRARHCHLPSYPATLLAPSPSSSPSTPLLSSTTARAYECAVLRASSSCPTPRPPPRLALCRPCIFLRRARISSHFLTLAPSTDLADHLCPA